MEATHVGGVMSFLALVLAGAIATALESFASLASSVYWKENVISIVSEATGFSSSGCKIPTHRHGATVVLVQV